MSAARWCAARALVLAALLGGCAMHPAVLQADAAYESGDMQEAARRYQQVLARTWLTEGEFDHATRRLRQSTGEVLERRLADMRQRLATGPVEQVLGELSELRAEQARSVGDPLQDQRLLEAMQQVAARDWPEVEALERRGLYRQALQRAQRLATFFPPEHPRWGEVERLRRELLAHPELPPVPEPPFPPQAEAWLRLLTELLAEGKVVEARVALIRAALAANLPAETFLERVIVLYGLGLPLRQEPPPQPPAAPESVKAASRPRSLSYTSWRLGLSPPEEGPETVAWRGFANVESYLETLYLLAPDIPTQPDRRGAYMGMRTAQPLLARIREDGWGWGLHDELLFAFYGGWRLSPAHVYPGSERKQEAGFSFGGMLAWSVLLGYRSPHLGLLVGVRPQYAGYQVGDITAAGTMLPVEAWLELRWSERYPVQLRAWYTLERAGNTTQGLQLQLPFSSEWVLLGRYESMQLDSRMGGLERDDRIDIGRRSSTWLSLGLGTRL